MHWRTISDAIPTGRITHDAKDGLIVNWDSMIGGARQRSVDGRWTVAVHDMIDGDMDTAPALSSVVANRADIASELLKLAAQLFDQRSDDSTVN